MRRPPRPARYTPGSHRDHTARLRDRRRRQASEACRKPGGEVALTLDGLDALDPPHRLDVAPVRDDLDDVVADEGDPVRALEARQVLDVHGSRDEEGGHAEPGELVAKLVGASVHVPSAR